MNKARAKTHLSTPTFGRGAAPECRGDERAGGRVGETRASTPTCGGHAVHKTQACSPATQHHNKQANGKPAPLRAGVASARSPRSLRPIHNKPNQRAGDSAPTSCAPASVGCCARAGSLLPGVSVHVRGAPGTHAARRPHNINKQHSPPRAPKQPPKIPPQTTPQNNPQKQPPKKYPHNPAQATRR